MSLGYLISSFGTRVPQTLVGYESMQPGFLGEGYPKLRALRHYVATLPGVSAYLASDQRFPFPAEGPIAEAYCANVNAVLGR